MKHRQEEVLKQDYEERRKIMDANPIHVAIAGRMMFKRVMGKASFCNIQDLQGNIQVYVQEMQSEKNPMQISKNLISVIFSVWKALLSEQEQAKSLSMLKKMTMLTKSLQILPEKFHGLTGHRYPLSSEICRPYHESGQQECIYQTFPDPQRDP